jgi:hypothetical protein
VIRDQDIEALRKLTPGQRVVMGIEATRAAWRFLLRLPPAERQRRLDLAREPWNPPRRPDPQKP